MQRESNDVVVVDGDDDDDDDGGGGGWSGWGGSERLVVGDGRATLSVSATNDCNHNHAKPTRELRDTPPQSTINRKTLSCILEEQVQVRGSSSVYLSINSGRIYESSSLKRLFLHTSVFFVRRKSAHRRGTTHTA